MKTLSSQIIALTLLTFPLFNPLLAVEGIAPKKQNIVFIAIEDFNPNHMESYGGKALTPNIDGLAREGVLFENAFCAAPVCNPSRTSLLTGLRPPSSGVFGNADEWKKLALPKIPATMPQHFKNNGYESVKAGKLFHYEMEHPESWSRDLETSSKGRKILNSYSAEVIASLKSLDPVEGGGYFSTDLQWGPVDCDPRDFRDGYYTTLVSDYLSEEHTKPFFLAIGFHAPHVKFAAPRQFFDLYDVDEIEIPDNPPNDLADMPTIHEKHIINNVLSTSQWREIKRAQFACISYVDWCIGQVMQAIQENGLEENTAIVVWTDHGFLLGEHFQWSKGGNKLFEETNKVAFIWKVPGITPAGTVSESVVETIDTFPTFFELCGIPVPEHVEGKSFVPLLENPSMPWKKAAYTWGTSNRVSIQTGRYRLNTNPDLNPESFELYDHHYDPNEYLNLSCNPQYAQIIDSLLSLYRSHTDEYFSEE